MFMLHVALELHSLSEDYGLESLEQFVKRDQSHALSLISLIFNKVQWRSTDKGRINSNVTERQAKKIDWE